MLALMNAVLCFYQPHVTGQQIMLLLPFCALYSPRRIAEYHFLPAEKSPEWLAGKQGEWLSKE